MMISRTEIACTMTIQQQDLKDNQIMPSGLIKVNRSVSQRSIDFKARDFQFHFEARLLVSFDALVNFGIRNKSRLL